MKKINFLVSTAACREHFELWHECFGDKYEEIRGFLDAAEGALIAECRLDGELAGMATLIPVSVYGEPCYYGYAVCTAQRFRGMGVCRALHEEIFRMCKTEDKGYFLHPANMQLFGMYSGFGMENCGYSGYSEYNYTNVENAKESYNTFVLRDATADDLAKTDSDVKWSRGLLEFAAAEKSGRDGICLVFSDGALAYGERRGDTLDISFSQGLDGEHLAVLCHANSCRRARLRMGDGNTPFLMGYNMSFKNIRIDFVFE